MGGLDANDALLGKAKFTIVDPEVKKTGPGGAETSGKAGETNAKKDASLEGKDLADICEADFDPPKQFVDRLICEGLTLLGAKPKVGKSWLLLSTGLARASGGFVAGSLKCTKGKSLLLMLEDSKRRLKGRVETLLMGLAVARGTTVFTKWPRGDEGITKLAEWLDAHPSVDFVGIDTLAKFSGPGDQKKNGNVYQTDYEKLNALQTMAARERYRHYCPAPLAQSRWRRSAGSDFGNPRPHRRIRPHRHHHRQ